MLASKTKAITAVITIVAFTAQANAQSTTTSPTSSFDWSAAETDTAITSFDLYTTDGELGPGQLDTSSRYGLSISTTVSPVVGPIGNGTVANGTTAAGSASTAVSGAAGTTSSGAGAGASSGPSSSGSADVSTPVETGNAAVKEGGMRVQGLGVVVGLGALVAAL